MGEEVVPYLKARVVGKQKSRVYQGRNQCWIATLASFAEYSKLPHILKSSISADFVSSTFVGKLEVLITVHTLLRQLQDENLSGGLR